MAAPCTQGLGRRDFWGHRTLTPSLHYSGTTCPDTASASFGVTASRHRTSASPAGGDALPHGHAAVPGDPSRPPHLRDVPPRGEGAPQWCHPAASCSGTSQAAVTLSWSSSAVTDGTGPGDREASVPAQHRLCHEQQAGRRTPPAGPAAPMGLTPAPAVAWAVSEAATPLQAAGVRK